MATINNNLYIPSIDAYIDPIKPVDKAIITHAHADHARGRRADCGHVGPFPDHVRD